MNKSFLIVAALVFFPSCARTYIREWKEGQVTACGNQAANKETIEKTAVEKCGSSVTLIGGGTVDAGMAHTGYGVFVPVRENCLTFKCEAGHAPASK